MRRRKSKSKSDGELLVAVDDKSSIFFLAGYHRTHTPYAKFLGVRNVELESCFIGSICSYELWSHLELNITTPLSW